MTFSTILPLSEPILNEVLPPFEYVDDLADVVARKLQEVLSWHPDGLGLSANQIGLPYRVFVMKGYDVEKGEETYTPYFNPQIRFQSLPTLMEEGCLSNPGFWVKIKRPSNIRVSYQDVHGEIQTKTYIGMSARCFLHELDHLDGINYLSRASKYHLEQAKKKSKILKRRLKKAAKIQPNIESQLDGMGIEEDDGILRLG